VDTYFQDPSGLPPVLSMKQVTPSDIRKLLHLCHKVFGVLFAEDLAGKEAANRFDALVLAFLEPVERVGSALHPTKETPIWLSKYRILGLLRCRQHFLDYTYVHPLYEGGLIGKGMVKELQPLCPNAVRAVNGPETL